MQKVIVILTLTFAVALSACGNERLKANNSTPHLNACSDSEVDDLILHVTYGAAKVRLTRVTYQNGGTYETNMNFTVNAGSVETIPYCNNGSKVEFRMVVEPTGPGVRYEYDHSVEIYYEVYTSHRDIRIWDNNGYHNFGSGYAGVQTHEDSGKTDSYFVAIEPWVW